MCTLTILRQEVKETDKDNLRLFVCCLFSPDQLNPLNPINKLIPGLPRQDPGLHHILEQLLVAKTSEPCCQTSLRPQPLSSVCREITHLIPHRRTFIRCPMRNDRLGLFGCFSHSEHMDRTISTYPTRPFLSQ